MIPPEITRRNATLLILIWRWPLDRVARRYGRGHRGARERSQRDLLATKSAICNFRPDRPVADFHCRLVCRCVSWRHNLPADVHADKLCSGYSESKRPRLEFELSLSRGRQVSVAAAAAAAINRSHLMLTRNRRLSYQTVRDFSSVHNKAENKRLLVSVS